MKKTILKTLILTSFLLCFSSCASILTESRQEIYIETEQVENVSVRYNGATLGKTPCVIDMQKKIHPPMLELKKEGYQTTFITLETTLEPVSILNLGNLFGWAIDIATGKIMRYQTTYYNVEMEKKK